MQRASTTQPPAPPNLGAGALEDPTGPLTLAGLPGQGGERLAGIAAPWKRREGRWCEEDFQEEGAEDGEGAEETGVVDGGRWPWYR